MAMMSCRDVGLRLQSYLDDELDPDRLTRIRDHLDACVECGLDFDVYAQIKSDISATRPDTDPGVIERLREFAHGISDRVEADRQT